MAGLAISDTLSTSLQRNTLERKEQSTMATKTTTKPKAPLTGDFPDAGSPVQNNGAQLVPLDEKELDLAILASAAGNDVAREIAERILSADTVDEILGTVDPTESLVGVVFKPIEWKWGRSSFGNKEGAFVVLKVLDLDGRERIVTSGSPNVMAALRAFERLDAPIPALTMRDAVTANGYTTYRLAKARAV
jgi:hypothetical protein